MLKEKSRVLAGHRMVPFLGVKLFGKGCTSLGHTNANSIYVHYHLNKDEPRAQKIFFQYLHYTHYHCLKVNMA